MDDLIRAYTPRNEVELAMLKGLLDKEGVSFYVQNENFGALKAGPQIPLFNARTIMIPKEQIIKAKEIIDAFVESAYEEDRKDQYQYTFKEKIRMFLEIVLFGWVVPGKRRWPKEDNYKKKEGTA